LYLCLVSWQGFSQSAMETAEREFLMVTQHGKVGAKSSHVHGSPFLFDELVQADVLMKKGEAYQGVLINIYPHKSQVFLGDNAKDPLSGKTVVLDTYNIDRVVLYGKERVFKPMKVGGRIHIVEVLYEGDEEIFVALHEKRFHPKQQEKSYVNTKDKVDSYRPAVRFFWVQGKQEWEIKKGKPGLKTLSADWKGLSQFAKTQKLDFNKPADMKKLFLEAKGGRF